MLSKQTLREHQALVELIRLRLNWVTYPELAYLVELLLTRMGYSQIHRFRQYFRGRTALAGADMCAVFESELGIVSTLVQVKRYARAVSTRFINEMRGAQLREAVPHGIVITTSCFSDGAVEAAHSFPGRPVRLIDGRELAVLLIGAGIGVVERKDIWTGETKLGLDVEAFELLRLDAEAKRLARKKRR